VCYCLRLWRETPAGVALGVTDWKVVGEGSSFRKTHPRASLARGGVSQGQGEWSTGQARERSALVRRDDHHHLRPLAAAARQACSKRPNQATSRLPADCGKTQCTSFDATPRLLSPNQPRPPTDWTDFSRGFTSGHRPADETSLRLRGSQLDCRDFEGCPRSGPKSLIVRGITDTNPLSP
jgi:hypothetical protein